MEEQDNKANSVAKLFPRGKGKNILDIKQYYWYSYYLKNTRFKKKLTRKAHAAFLKDLFDTFTDKIIYENFELKLIGLGKFRIQSKKSIIVTKKGKVINTLRTVDWKATWDYWRAKFPGKEDKEIVELVKLNKVTVVYRDNDEHCRFIWDNKSCATPNKGLYKFIPSKLNVIKLVNAISDPNRKVFYYG